MPIKEKGNLSPLGYADSTIAEVTFSVSSSHF